MAEAQPYPTTCGFFIERFLIPSILNYFGSGPIDQHKYIQTYFKNKHDDKLIDVPTWLKGATLPKRSVQAPWIKVPDEGKSFLHFLKNDEAVNSTPFFIPENVARPDGFLKLTLADNTHRPCLTQFKFYSNMSETLAESAIFTTSLDGLYTEKFSQMPMDKFKDRREAVIAILKKHLNAGKGMLRIVFLYPHSPVEPIVEKNGDVILILDQNHSPDLFDEKIWKFLYELKFESVEKTDEEVTMEIENAKILKQMVNSQASDKKRKQENIKLDKMETDSDVNIDDD